MKFPGGANFGQLMAQAQQMQSEMKKLQEKLNKQEMNTESAGGRIKITINGKQEISQLHIAPELVKDADAAMLSDLMKIAVNDAIAQSQKVVAAEMSRIVPPGMAGMF